MIKGVICFGLAIEVSHESETMNDAAHTKIYLFSKEM